MTTPLTPEVLEAIERRAKENLDYVLSADVLAMFDHADDLGKRISDLMDECDRLAADLRAAKAENEELLGHIEALGKSLGVTETENAKLRTVALAATRTRRTSAGYPELCEALDTLDQQSPADEEET